MVYRFPIGTTHCRDSTIKRLRWDKNPIERGGFIYFISDKLFNIQLVRIGFEYDVKLVKASDCEEVTDPKIIQALGF